MSWHNNITGLNTDRDKATGLAYTRTLFSAFQLDDYADAYCHDDVTHTAAARVPQVMFSQGFEVWQGMPTQEATRLEALEERLEKLGTTQHVRDALIWERLFGGGGVLLGADDGREKKEPLVERDVRSVRFLDDLDRRDMHRRRRSPEIRAVFDLGQLTIHSSRFALFQGDACPRREAVQHQYWGIGAIARAWNEIGQFHAAWAEFRHLISDGNQAAYKIPGLVDLLSTEDGLATVIDRYRTIDYLRSNVRALLLDSTEELQRDATTLTGYADALAKSFERLAMALRMPVTVLVGISPAGLNATGESDRRLWNQSVAAQRKQSVDPALLRIARLVQIANGLDPKGLEIRWPNLEEPTATETATNESAEATTTTATLANLAQARKVGAITEAEHLERVRAALGMAPA